MSSFLENPSLDRCAYLPGLCRKTWPLLKTEIEKEKESIFLNLKMGEISFKFFKNKKSLNLLRTKMTRKLHR